MDELPRLIEPRPGATGPALERIAEVAPGVESGLAESGAVLLRGFDLRSAAEFGRVADLFAPHPLPYVRGISPRHAVSGRVYTSTDAPRFLPIPLHCEMAYSAIHPDRILFWCEVPPQAGGQTPLADMGRVYRALDPAVRRRFEEHGLRMIQNVPARRGWNRWGRTWSEMFETHDPREVARACAERGIDGRFKPDGSLRLISHGPAAIDHPRTGERIWFNSAHLLHASWDWEPAPEGRPGIGLLVGLAERAERRWRPAEDLSRHCQFGDGSEIPAADLTHVRQVLRAKAVTAPWRRGDVLVLDNLRVGHGRKPFRGSRRILVALGNSRPEGPLRDRMGVY